MLDVVLVGCGGTVPLKNRWLTACYLRCNGRAMLIDCGEGTQIAIKEAGVSLYAINAICLTHYHADHISGLPGLLLSLGNEGRTDPLAIYGPVGLQRIVNGLRVIAPELPFSLELHEYLQPQESFTIGDLSVTAFAVKHTLPCYGYRMQLPRAGKFDPIRAKHNQIPMAIWSTLQKGNAVTYEGVSYSPQQVLGAPRKGLSVVYCTDTRPLERIATMAQGADLFICEGMYGDASKQDKALETQHMTFSEAAQLAKQAEVRSMWLTHYSPSLPEPNEYLADAQAIFAETQCGFDGQRTTLRFED
ncbi:MAG: ribonuclease Z [Oscillospiraceae bacterium]